MQKHSLILKIIFVSLLLTLIHDSTAFANPGDIDTSFGTNGIVISDIGGFDTAIDVVTQDDSKIIVSGTTFGSSTNFALVRYDSDGTTDSTFGTNGLVVTNLSTSDVGRELVVQSDGKIIVGGSSEINGNKDFAVIRYNPDGTLDTNFDSDGIVITPVSGNADEVWGIALQADGKIIAVGDSDSQIAVARYNSNGSLDTSFGTNGIATPAGGSGQAVKIQSDGKIVVAGRSGGQFAVIRLDSSGTLDNSFDSDGIATTFMGSGTFVSGWDLDIQADGKIVTSGASFNGSNYDISVIRYNSNGSLDNSFDSDGIFTFDSGNGNDEGSAIIIQPNSKIVVGGYSNTGSGEAFTVIRLNSDGTYDTSFSGDGIVVTEEGQRGLGLTTQDDNKILMTGYSSGDYVTARYEGDPVPNLDKFVYLPTIIK